MRRLSTRFAPSAVVPFERFPYNYYDVLEPDLDLEDWTLTVEGEVRRAGPKIPQHDFLTVPKAFTIGGWLGGALQWHFTFMWIFVGTGLSYLVYQVVTGNFREVLFLPRDAKGVWPISPAYAACAKLWENKPASLSQRSPRPEFASTGVPRRAFCQEYRWPW